MRVLHVIDSVVRCRGAGHELAVTAEPLFRCGVDLDVVYLRDVDGLQPELSDAKAALFGVHHRCLPATTRALRALVRQRHPDLVHTSMPRADVVGRVVGRLCGVPVVSTAGPSAVGGFGDGVTRGAVRALQPLTAREVRRFRALTRYDADVLARRPASPRARIDVVPPGRDPGSLAVATRSRGTTRAGLGLRPGTPVVLAASRHEHDKGLDVLLAAFAGPVLQAVPDAVLLLAGPDGPRTAALRGLAGERAQDGGPVRFLGERRDVPALMAACEVFVAPGRRAGTGGAVVEAMGVGTPVVATDLPPTLELVGADGAVLVPPGDVAALGAAVADALTDQGSARDRAHAASARFAERNTVESVGERMVEFYERALQRAAP